MQIQHLIWVLFASLAIAPSLIGSSSTPTQEHYKFPQLDPDECPVGIFAMRPWDEAMAASEPESKVLGVVMLYQGRLATFTLSAQYKNVLSEREMAFLIEKGLQMDSEGREASQEPQSYVPPLFSPTPPISPKSPQ